MRSVSLAEAYRPIRPRNQHSVSGDRARAQHRIAVCFGVGERTGKSMEMLPMDAGEEVVEAEEESQPVNTLPSPTCQLNPSGTSTISRITRTGAGASIASGAVALKWGIVWETITAAEVWQSLGSTTCL